MKFLPILLAAALLAGCTGTSSEATSSAPKEAVEIPTATLQASYEKASGAFEANRSDADAKKAYVDATVAYGTAVMARDGKPSEKYPQALALYDEALGVDPTNDEAKTNRQLILDIYKQMGKEPPK